MTLWTELYPERALLSRKFYLDPGQTIITAPAGANILRASMVGAGGYSTSAGSFYFAAGGAAFARVKASCAAGQQFKVQVGNRTNAVNDGSVDGNSYLQRISDSVYLAIAERGKASGPGLAANSIGDVTRSGSAGSVSGNIGTGGASGTDDADQYSLGIGGRGGAYQYSAMPGGGGAGFYVNRDVNAGWISYGTCYNGNGRVCVEFFNADPGY